MKKRYYLLALVAIVILAHLKYILTGNPMIFFGDNIEQILPFYYHGWDLAHDGNLYLWDWNHSLGASIFSHVYYFITSPFFWISTLFPREWMPHLFLYLYILKLSLLAIFSFLWLTQLNKNHKVSFIGAIAITFSGWVMTYYHFFFFLDSFLLYPLVLYGIEKYVKERKKGILLFSIAAVTIINFYFSYSLIPFAMLYSLFRISLTYKGKQIILNQLKVIGWYLLGIGLAGTILVPSALIILQTPRLGESDLTLTSMLTLKQLYRFITSVFVPVGHRFDPNYLISYANDPGIGWGGGASLYTSLLTPLLVPLLFFIKNKREKICLVIFGGLLSFFMMFKIFYVLFHGSLESRWMYMFTFLFVMILTKVLDEYFDNTNDEYRHKMNKVMMIMGIATICVIWGLFFLTYKKQWNVKPAELIWLKNNAILSIMVILSYLVVFNIPKLKHKELIIVIILLIESLIAFKHVIEVDAPLTKEGVVYGEVERENFFSELQKLDDSFYRIEFNAKGFSDNNLPMSSHFNGFRFYSSVYQYPQDEFMSQLKAAPWSITRVYGKENILNLLSYKYFVDFIGNDYPPYGFEYYTHLLGYPVYINQNVSSLGFTFTNVMSESEFNMKTPLEQNLIYPYYLVVPDEYVEQPAIDKSLVENLEVLLADSYPGYYEFSFEEVYEDVMVYVENFGSPNVNVKAYLDDEIVYDQSIYQFNFVGAYVKAPFNKLEINVEGIDSSPGWLNIYLDKNLGQLNDIYQSREKESFELIEFNNDHISGKVTVEQNAKWLFTSIPYDKGWKVKVNGEVIDPIKVNQGFLGFKLEPGTHELEFNYYPPGLNAGIGLSVLSGVIIIFIYLKQRYTK